eukprot:4990103-Prymnesium_polylepis.1
MSGGLASPTRYSYTTVQPKCEERTTTCTHQCVAVTISINSRLPSLQLAIVHDPLQARDRTGRGEFTPLKTHLPTLQPSS